MSETNNNSEVSFDSLFQAGLNHYDQHGSIDMASNEEDKDQSSVATETTTNTESLSETQDMPLEGTTPENTDSQTSTSTIDYQQLYEQTKKDADAKMGLLYSRLNDLSSKYQAVLDINQGNSTKKEADASEDEYANSLKEFKEIYPDIAKAVEYIVKKEVDGTRKSVEDVIGQQVQPIRQYLEHNTRENYVARITNAHPDIQSLIDSGVVVRWVNSLDPVRQAGAQTIMQNGSADQVIQLLNEYKLSNGSPSVGIQQKQTPVATQTPAASMFNREEEIAKRVVQMLGVPSNSVGLDVKPQGLNVLKPEGNYATDLTVAMKEWEKNNRR